MPKKIYWVLAAVVMAAAGAFLFFKNAPQPAANNAETKPTSAPPATLKDGFALYTNAKLGYSLQYPANFAWREEADLSVFGLTAGAQLPFPEIFMAGTNLREAWISVGAKPFTTLESCPPPGNTGRVVMPINNIIFSYTTGTSAAAGNYYENRSLSSVRNEMCYNVILLMHSVNRDNFDEADRPKEFNKEPIENLFEEIARTFEFIK